jgi:hypothetical protein
VAQLSRDLPQFNEAVQSSPPGKVLLWRSPMRGNPEVTGLGKGCRQSRNYPLIDTSAFVVTDPVKR